MESRRLFSPLQTAGKEGRKTLLMQNKISSDKLMLSFLAVVKKKNKTTVVKYKFLKVHSCK